MIVLLALRNIWQQLSRRLFVALVIALTIAVLLIGNTFFQATDSGVQEAYRNSFTGDFSISTVVETPFTVFGNDLLLVGEYETLPVLADPLGIETALQSNPDIEKIAHQVSTQAYIEIEGAQNTSPVFGVDFFEYFSFFTALRILSGDVKHSSSPGAWLNEALSQEMGKQLGHQLKIGDRIKLTSTNTGGFTIREVPLLGIFAYPVGDAVINRIVVVDAETARALNGYVYGASRKVNVKLDQTNLIDASGGGVDSLFGDASDITASSDAKMEIEQIEQGLKRAAPASQSSKTDESAWNFIFIRLKPGVNAIWAGFSLGKILPDRGGGIQLRDWRGTAGGNSQLVWFIRILFNVGMLFIAVMAIFVMTNTLALSVYERIREIGTMRAIGAQKSFVAALFGYETMILVAGAGLLGISLGTCVILVLGKVGIPITNPFLATMFGSSLVRPVIISGEILWHFCLCLIIGVIALLWPLRVALEIQPVHAMAKEA